MLRLFLADAKETNTGAKKWRASLNALTEAIYKSRNSLSQTLAALEKPAQAKPGPVDNSWGESSSPVISSRDRGCRHEQ